MSTDDHVNDNDNVTLALEAIGERVVLQALLRVLGFRSATSALRWRA